MSLILEFEAASGRSIRAWVRSFEVLVVGRGMQSDVVCDFDLHMAEKHFQVANSDLSWVVRLLAPYPAELFVNGQAITAWEHPLEDGDTIQAGNTQFAVSIEGASKRNSPALSLLEEKMEMPDSDEPSIEWHLHEKCPICARIDWKPDGLFEILKSVAGTDRILATINQVQLGWSVRGLNPKGSDLFAAAPDEVKSTDSLQLEEIPVQELEKWFTPLLNGMQGNGVCLLVTGKSLNELTREKRFVWAWFARPQNLSFHLIQGSDHLRNLLLAGLVCIILSDPSRPDRWVLFASKENLVVCRERLQQTHSLLQ